MWKDAQTLYNSKEDFDTVVTQKSGGCFITSAVCRVLGKPDDCEELQVLRKFRDTYMTRDAGMSRDVAEYYEVAPKICAAIEESPDGGLAEYTAVYACALLPALALIQIGDYRWAYLVYKTMVERLKEKYIVGGEE
jgi:hypothetical protein